MAARRSHELSWLRGFAIIVRIVLILAPLRVQTLPFLALSRIASTMQLAR